MKRRITVEEYTRSYNPDNINEPEFVYTPVAEVSGTEKTVAGFLRALADEIDPPKEYR